LAEPLEIGFEDWIIVPKWDRFQHYKNRKPAWIKVYTDLLENPHYLNLSMASKGLLQVIWCAYAAENGQIRVTDVARFCHRSATIVQLESLYHAGFIAFSASKPLAPNKEVEKEKETPLPPSVENPNPEGPNTLESRAFNYAADWNGGTSEEFHEGLDTLERELHRKLTEVQRMKLGDLAFSREKTNQGRVDDADDW